MIRLVTQFDRPQTRVAAATPTCGCCSCCCCCVATVITASIYTPRNVQATLRRATEETPERVRWRSPWPTVLGGFAAPLFVVALVLTWWTVITPFVVWFALVGLAYRGAGHLRPWRRAAILATVGSVAFVAEFFIWAAVLLA